MKGLQPVRWSATWSDVHLVAWMSQEEEGDEEEGEAEPEGEGEGEAEAEDEYDDSFEDDYEEEGEGDGDGSSSWQPDPVRLQHMRSAMMIQRAACLDLIGEQAFNEL